MSRLVPILLIFLPTILQQAPIISKRFAYYSQQGHNYYSDPNRHSCGKIVHGTPTLTFLAA